MGAKKFRCINYVEFLLIYLGTGKEQKRYVRAAKGFAKGQVGIVNKVCSNDGSEFMIKVHQLLQNNGSDRTA